MDINDFIKNGATIPNPNYKKPSKSNPAGSPRFIQSDNYEDALDYGSRVGRTLAENSYDLTHLNSEDNKYGEYDVHINPVNTQEELNAERAKNQSAWEQTGHFLTQAGLNEVLIGTVLGLSNLVDMGINLGTEEGEDDYTNPFSTWLEGLQDDVRKRFEIYRKDPNATWAIGDFGWWADNAVSIASTASMLIPSTGVVKGLGYVGKALNVGKLSRGVAKAANYAKLTKTPAKLAQAIDRGAEIGTTALLSRTMENYLESRGVYNEVYDNSFNKLKALSEEERQELLANNPQFANKTDEEIAQYISSVSADETFRNDYAMLLFDIAQFKAISALWKKIPNKAATANLRIANRNATVSLSKETLDQVEKTGFIAARKEAIKNAINNPLTSIAAIEWSEGIEEGYQGIQTEKGKEVAEKIFDPSFDTRTIDSYLTDGAIWEQAFWGVLGGMGFQAVGTGLGNLSNKIKGKYNKRTLSEEEYALSQLTEEKIREVEINGRKAVMQNFVDGMQKLNSGKNPFAYKLDPITKQPILEEGSAVNEDISQAEAEDLKARLVNDFVTDMTLNATDKGNYELLKEFVTNENFDKFFEEAGLNRTAGDKSFSQQLIAKMDEVHNEYTNSLYDIINSIDVENENVAKAESRNIVRRKLAIKDINNAILNAENEIAQDTDDINLNRTYEEKQRVGYIKRQLDELDKAEAKMQQDVANKSLSKQAYEEYRKEYDQRRNQLLDFAGNNTSFGTKEEVKNILSQTFGSRNVNSFIASFNSFVDEFNKPTNTTESTAVPKKSIQDIIAKKIELQDNVSALSHSLPKTQEDYQKEYNDLALSMDRLTRERYNKAVDKVNKYIESQDDTNKAVEDIISGNVSEDLKESLDILKVGHHSTREFANQINTLIKEINKRKAKEAEDARVVVSDGEQLTDEQAEREKADIERGISSTGEVTSDDATDTTDTSDTTDKTKVVTVDNPSEFIPIPEAEVTSEINAIEKDAIKIQEAMAQDFIVDVDSRAVGLASSITFELFKTSKNLFDNLEGKDTNSEEFGRLLDAVSEELFVQGVSRGITKSAAMDGIKLSLNTIYRRLNARNVSNADTFKRLADELSTRQKIDRDADGKASNTTFIPDSELNSVIDEFIESYIQHKEVVKSKNSKTIINVEDIFRELLNNDDISYEQARHIFYNISDYVSNPNNTKYIFTNKSELIKNANNPASFFAQLISSKTTVEEIDNYMHIAAPTKRDKNYNTAVNEAANGQPVDITYYEGEFGSSTNSISIKRNGVEIGYLSAVVPNSTNTGYTLKKQIRGFNYEVSEVNGLIESSLDNLFINLINQSNDNYDKLMDLCYKQYAFETAIKNQSLGTDITIDEAEQVLANTEIAKLINNKKLIIPDSKITNKQKAQYILNAINNIIFYNQEAITANSILESYNYWKRSVYNNYENTHKIQLALNENKKITTKLAGIDVRKVIIDEVNHNVNELGFTYEQNPVMIVDANGNIISESNSEVYNNTANFMPGTMGVVVQDNPNAPIIALFTEANPLSSNSNLANRVYTELTNIIESFQSGTMSFEEIGDALFDMFSGPGAKGNHNNLFSGYSVIRSSDNIALNINGVKGAYNLIIHKTSKGSSVNGTGITYLPNGDKTKAISSVTPNKKFIQNIAKEIVSNLSFNKTFYAINNKAVANEKSNRYFYKENGKLVVNIGGAADTYNNYSHFVLSTNAFKTNQGVNSEGGYFNVEDKIKSLYIDTSIINSPVEEENADRGNADRDNAIEDKLKQATKSKSVSVKELLDSTDIGNDKIDVLTGKNQYDIALIPTEVYRDSKATKADAYYSKGKIYFTNRGIGSVKNSPANLVRLLMHENLHAQFNTLKLFEREGLVDDLMDTYNAFIEAINNDLLAEDKTSERYKTATAINEWINRNKFNPIDYFSTLSAEQQRAWKQRTDAERIQQFTEEWLVESLTQPVIIRYLNETVYSGGEVNVEGIDSVNKSIWQKIIDVILKLFGKYDGNIKNNTILAKQYSILGDNTNTEANAETNVITVEEVNDNTDSPGDSVTDKTVEEDKGITTTEEETSPVNDKKDKINAVDAYQIESDIMDETSEVDDLDFSITDEVTTVDEVNIETYRNSPDINTNGVSVISNMNDYTNTFAEQDKPLIANMIADNQIKFACE